MRIKTLRVRALPLAAGLLVVGITVSARAAKIQPLVGKSHKITARRGDTLTRIARRENVDRQTLARLNHLRRERIRHRRTLLVPSLFILPRNPQNGIVLNIPERRVFIFKNGTLLAHYPVAVGKASWPTDLGTFRLAEKKVNPVWKPTPHMVRSADIKDDPVPPGPGNPLGDRWMGWSDPGVGFHSTNAPGSIGKAISHGCVRLYPDAARRMFHQVSVGMAIFSVYEPVQIGERGGKYFLAVFPDIYHKGLATLAHVEKMLAAVGLLSRVDKKQVAHIVKAQDGYPERIVVAQEKAGAGKPKPEGKKPSACGREPAQSSATRPPGIPMSRLPFWAQLARSLAAQAEQSAGRLLKRYRDGRITFLSPERDGAQIEQVARQGYFLDPKGVPVAFSPVLLSTLDRLSERSTGRKPLSLLSLYRPLSEKRPREPHGNALAADIAAYNGHRILNTQVRECVAGVLAVLKALPPGQYRLGLPKPPGTDLIACFPPPPRPSYWPFFPAPVPETVELLNLPVVAPRLENGKFVTDWRGHIRPVVRQWENEQSAPVSEIGDAGVRACLQSAGVRGAHIYLLFPDAADHLHLDVMPPS